MFSHLRSAVLTSVVAVSLVTGILSSVQAAPAEFEPIEGQAGKDVIWVPTPKALVRKMLQMAEVKPVDNVIDLGSGDGITVITAAKEFGARATGIEYNPDMVELARKNARQAGVRGRADFIQGDIFTTDFTKATVLTLYLLPHLNLKLRPTILDMKPGTRVVSHAFTMEDWIPDETDVVESRTAYLWIVPARVQGRWRIGSDELELDQKFQVIEGTYRAGTKTWRVSHANLRGDQISFSVGRARYSGRVTGKTMKGTLYPQPHRPPAEWSATLIR
jgi:SAM-dependent methyltransferase